MRHEYSEAGNIEVPLRSGQPQPTLWPSRIQVPITRKIPSLIPKVPQSLLPSQHQLKVQNFII